MVGGGGNVTGREGVEVALQAGVEFFHVADAHGAAGRGREHAVPVELEVHGVFEALPLSEREQTAPRRIAVGHLGSQRTSEGGWFEGSPFRRHRETVRCGRRRWSRCSRPSSS